MHIFLIKFNFFLDHPWIKEDGEAPDTPLDNAVFERFKQFRAMNKFKKVALRVLFQYIKFELTFFLSGYHINENSINDINLEIRIIGSTIIKLNPLRHTGLSLMVLKLKLSGQS